MHAHTHRWEERGPPCMRGSCEETRVRSRNRSWKCHWKLRRRSRRVAGCRLLRAISVHKQTGVHVSGLCTRFAIALQLFTSPRGLRDTSPKDSLHKNIPPDNINWKHHTRVITLEKSRSIRGQESNSRRVTSLRHGSEQGTESSELQPAELLYVFMK